MQRHSWKPLVYMGVTLAAVLVVLSAVYGILKLGGVSLRDLGRGGIAAACATAYATVLATNYLLKRYFGRSFGTYLDDADSDVSAVAPGIEKHCARCGSTFQAHRNDAHDAGFCSRACRKAFARRSC